MASIDTAFGRTLLSQLVPDLKKAFPKLRIMRDGWTWHAGRDLWEFHGPDKFYWHGSAGNAYEARYKGWCAYLESKGITDYVRGE